MKRLLVFILLICCVRLFATSYFSKNDGGWRDEPNTWGWGYPTILDDAYVSNAVTMSTHEEVHDMIIASIGSVMAASKNLTSDGTCNMYGLMEGISMTCDYFNFNAGDLDSMHVTAPHFSWAGGNMLDSLIECTDGGVSFNGTKDLDNSGIINGDGTFVHGDDAKIDLENSTSYIKNSGTWQVAANDYPFGGIGYFQNTGTFRKNGSGRTYMTIPYQDLAGTMKVDDGNVCFNSVTGGHLFSNTVFDVASGTYVVLTGDAWLKGNLTSMDVGALDFWSGTFYLTNNCTIDMGSGSVSWSGGYFRNNSLKTMSKLIFQKGSATHYLRDCTLTAEGGVEHIGSSDMKIYNGTLNIPSGATYDIQVDGTTFTKISSGQIFLDGTMKKSAGSGEAGGNVPVYGTDSKLQVDSGTLYFSGGGRLDNPIINMASGTRIEPGLMISNAVVSSTGTCSVVYENDASACGVWNVTNTTFSQTSSIDVTPSLTLQGSNVVFNIYTGSLSDGIISNYVNIVAPASGGNRYFSNCNIENFNEANFYNNGPYLTSTKYWRNHVGAVHNCHAGTSLFNNNSGYYYNYGTFRKTGSSDYLTHGGSFIDRSGLIKVENGTLELTDDNSEFHNTLVQLSSNTTFRMSSKITSNLVVSASGPAYLYLGENYEQTIQTDIVTTGEVTYVVYENDIEMTGSLKGDDASLNWVGRGFQNGSVTSSVPCTISGGSSKYLSYAGLYLEKGAEHTGTYLNITRSTLYNMAESEYIVDINGTFINGTYGQFKNYGTLRKVGTGEAASSLTYIHDGGDIFVDSGILALCSSQNQFNGTDITLGSNVQFRMAGELTTNITVTATEPATLQVAGDYVNQTLDGPIQLNGPVTFSFSGNQMYVNNMSLNGDEASFTWSGGSIYDGRLTNNIPAVISGTSTRWLNEAYWEIMDDVEHQSGKVYILRCHARVHPGCTYTLGGDGTLLQDNTSGYFYNKGTFKKTAGTGVTDIYALFYNQEGIIGSEMGTLKFNKDIELDFTNGGLDIELNSNSYGRVQSVSSVVADGDLTVSLADGYVPEHGEEFSILSGSSLTGAFTSTNLPVLSGGQLWRVQQSFSTLKLTVVSADDLDGDFMKNDWETRHGLDPEVKDQLENPDNDPCDNLSEYIADTDPNNSNDWFMIAAAVSNNCIMFNSSTQRLYTLKRSVNVVSDDWISIVSPRFGIGSNDFMIDTNNNISQKYYKLKVENPE